MYYYVVYSDEDNCWQVVDETEANCWQTIEASPYQRYEDHGLADPKP